jgi:hypothetical protein
MMQKRTIYSLLLTSLILVFAFSSASAQQVTFGSASVLRCQSGAVNITVNNPSSISALEIVFDISSISGGADFSSFTVTWDAGFASPVLPERDIIIDGKKVRMYAWKGTGGECLGIGTNKVVARINFVTNDVCDGQVGFAGGEWVCQPPSLVTAQTQFVDCATSGLVAAVVNAGTITVTDAKPVLTAIPDSALHWGQTYHHTAIATDNDLLAVPGGCETLTFSKLDGPDDLTVTSNGVINWVTTSADVCVHPVQVLVVDACEPPKADTVSFNICVQNTKPEITCPDDIVDLWGETITGAVTAVDPDHGPGALLFSKVSFNGPGTFTVNPDGTFSWPTEATPTYIGTFTACVTVKDAAPVCSPCSPENADTCCFDINIRGYQVTIEKVHKVKQGRDTTVTISSFISDKIGGFDFLIKYDPTALMVNTVLPGSFITGCKWEYFTYRHGANGNCGANACPSGMLRIVAIAETNNGDHHPICFVPGVADLAVINFLVTNDRTFECQYIPIKFYWYDCGDNALSDKSGDTLLISRDVYDYSWDAEFPAWINIADPETPDGYPTEFGAQNSDCFILNPNKIPFRWVDFRNGGIDIVCADSIDARGDINLNDVPYEVADAVLFSNYFVHGSSVFHTNPDGQIAATDVNADGVTLSVADLVYLIRVVVGDALPYDKAVVPVNAGYVHSGNGVLRVTDDVKMGAAYVVVEGNVEPTLLAGDMEILYNSDGLNTRILVWSPKGNSFSGEFLSVQGNLVSIEMATAEGNPVVAKPIPTDFALNQNYPNPFNPTTTLSFALPSASDYILTIYNVNGQEVAAFSGKGEAGTRTIEWNAGSLASGIYLYKLQADGRTIDTKKMVLLK